MAWSKLGQRSKPYGSYAGGFKIARPAGATKGCLLVAVVDLHESPPAINSSNFTQRQNSTTTGDRWAVFEKEDDGSQEFEVAWTGTHEAQGFLFAFSPGAGNKAVYDTSSIRTSGPSKSILTTGITIAEAAELLANLSVEDHGLAMVQPTGFTEITDEGTEETHGIHVGWKEQGAGATGEQNFKEASAELGGLGVLIAWKAVSSAAILPLAAAGGAASTTLTLHAMTAVPLAGATGSSSTALGLSVPKKVTLPLAPAAAGAGVSLQLRAAPQLILQAGGSAATVLVVTAPAPPVQIPRSTKPPLALAVEVITADGWESRLDPSSRTAGKRPQGLSFATQRGEGNGPANFTVTRKVMRDYADLNLLDTTRFIGMNDDVAYDGVNHDFARTNDPLQQFAVSLIGPMALLEKRRFSETYVDRSHAGFTDTSNDRKLHRYEAGMSPSGSMSSQGDETTGLPVLTLNLDRVVANHFAEGLYRSEVPIGDVYLDLVTKNIGEGWQIFVELHDDDSWLSAFDTSGNIAPGPFAGLVPSTTERRKCVVLIIGYVGAGGPLEVSATAFFRNLAIFGTSAVPKRGATGELGFYVSDLSEDIVNRFTPLTWSEENTKTTYPVQQAAYKRSTPLDAIRSLNDVHLFEIGVYDDREFFFRPADLTQADWIVRTDDPGVRFTPLQGDSIDGFANGVEVTYTDFFGIEHTLYPTDFPELRDESPTNPANRHNIPLWAELAIPYPTTLADAVQMGLAKLAEVNRPKAPGTISVAGGYVRDAEGHWHQGWKVRSSETIALANHPNDAPRLITATNWDQDSKVLQVSVDNGYQLLEAFLARQAIRREAANLG